MPTRRNAKSNNTVLTITLALVYYCPNWMYSFYRFLEKIVLLRDRKRTNIHEFGKLLKETQSERHFESLLQCKTTTKQSNQFWSISCDDRRITPIQTKHIYIIFLHRSVLSKIWLLKSQPDHVETRGFFLSWDRNGSDKQNYSMKITVSSS